MKPQEILERIKKHNTVVKLALLCILLNDLGMEAKFKENDITRKGKMKRGL